MKKKLFLFSSILFFAFTASSQNLFFLVSKQDSSHFIRMYYNQFYIIKTIDQHEYWGKILELSDSSMKFQVADFSVVDYQISFKTIESIKAPYFGSFFYFGTTFPIMGGLLLIVSPFIGLFGKIEDCYSGLIASGIFLGLWLSGHVLTTIGDEFDMKDKWEIKLIRNQLFD